MPWRLSPGVKKARLRVFRSLRAAALAAEQKRPIVGLLTAHDAEQDSIGLDPIIVALLQACRATDGQRSLRAVAQEANRQAPGVTRPRATVGFGPSFRACRQDCASPGGLGASSLAWGPLGQSRPASKMRSM